MKKLMILAVLALGLMVNVGNASAGYRMDDFNLGPIDGEETGIQGDSYKPYL